MQTAVSSTGQHGSQRGGVLGFQIREAERSCIWNIAYRAGDLYESRKLHILLKERENQMTLLDNGSGNVSDLRKEAEDQLRVTSLKKIQRFFAKIDPKFAKTDH